VLARGWYRRGRCGLVVSSILVAIVSHCCLPHFASAQQATTQPFAPAAGGSQTGAPGDSDRDAGQPEGTGTAHDHLDGQHVTRNQAELEQQELHAAIQKKFKDFNTALKKAALDQHGAQRRRQEASRQGQNHVGGTSSAATAANTLSAPKRHIVSLPIPNAARVISNDVPGSPHSGRSQLTVVGGIAPYDPKKAAVLDGAAVHHRL